MTFFIIESAESKLASYGSGIEAACTFGQAESKRHSKVPIQKTRFNGNTSKYIGTNIEKKVVKRRNTSLFKKPDERFFITAQI